VAEKQSNLLRDIFQRPDDQLLNEWIAIINSGGNAQENIIREADLRSQCKELITLIGSAMAHNAVDIRSNDFVPVLDYLGEISRARALKGATPTQTAMFVYSLKRPIFDRLRNEVGKEAGKLADESWAATLLIDAMGLYIAEVFQKAREEVIIRQQEEMLELSTPVVKLWEGVLALPMIGTLDSARTQVVMQTLLQRIVETGAEIAIIDITGVPTVDTLVAQHLIKTVTAARLMGADCIISGIRPQIAQTIVHLGVDLADVTTKANLSDAFTVALRRTGYSVHKNSANKPA